MDLCLRQPIWSQPVRCLAQYNAQRTMWEHQVIMLEIHRAKTLNSGNPPINFIHHHPGIVTRLCSLHFQVLPSSTTRHHSTWHQTHSQALVRPKNIRVMGHRGKHMISTKEDMVEHKCSPLSNSQNMGRHLQVHLEWLQHRLETIQSFGWPLRLPLLQDNFPAHMVHPPISLSTKQFQPAEETHTTDVAGIANLLPMPDISYDQYDAEYESNNSSDFGGAEGKAPISLKQTELTLKQFAKRMGQHNFSTFNKRKKVWVAGFHEIKHQSIVRGQNRLKQLRDGPLHWETAVSDFLQTFKTRLPLEN